MSDMSAVELVSASGNPSRDRFAPLPSNALRLVWAQWQGAGPDAVAALYPELDLDEARRSYALGTQVLDAILPPHSGTTAVVPVPMTADGLERRDGIDAKDAVLSQLAAARRLLDQHAPTHVLTLGGDCSVSVAPFAHLASVYGDDLAVVWIDSHPDVGTPASQYHGYHAMAVATITGHNDPEILAELPAVISAGKVALVGLHSWTDDDFPNAAHWGIQTLSPSDVRATSGPLLDWLASTGCTKLAVHFDVDSIDSNQEILGLGMEPGGLRAADVERLVHDLREHAEIVGFTVAEYIPRQVLFLRRLLGALGLR